MTGAGVKGKVAWANSGGNFSIKIKYSIFRIDFYVLDVLMRLLIAFVLVLGLSSALFGEDLAEYEMRAAFAYASMEEEKPSLPNPQPDDTGSKPEVGQTPPQAPVKEVRQVLIFGANGCAPCARVRKELKRMQAHPTSSWTVGPNGMINEYNISTNEGYAAFKFYHGDEPIDRNDMGGVPLFVLLVNGQPIKKVRGYLDSYGILELYTTKVVPQAYGRMRFSPTYDLEGVKPGIQAVFSLLRDGKLVLSDGAWIESTSTLNFQTSYANDVITIKIVDKQPLLVVKKFITLRNSITGFVIKPNEIIINVNGFPDIHFLAKS